MKTLQMQHIIMVQQHSDGWIITKRNDITGEEKQYETKDGLPFQPRFAMCMWAFHLILRLATVEGSFDEDKEDQSSSSQTDKLKPGSQLQNVKSYTTTSNTTNNIDHNIPQPLSQPQQLKLVSFVPTDTGKGIDPSIISPPQPLQQQLQRPISQPTDTSTSSTNNQQQHNPSIYTTFILSFPLFATLFRRTHFSNNQKVISSTQKATEIHEATSNSQYIILHPIVVLIQAFQLSPLVVGGSLLDPERSGSTPIINAQQAAVTSPPGSIVNDGNGCCFIEANRAMAEWSEIS
ncbi:MAG: hypothetical protein EZS28_040624 [Streblomastix strix]|uniref:Uncharacterized protein n=1 Tax=Streblomastix strix TaxID=222440 RepID=A0A5J4U0R8_9EUKA|nr:MAG: hypothetical protein EZS28_040624 [Streblomastix strix]